MLLLWQSSFHKSNLFHVCKVLIHYWTLLGVWSWQPLKTQRETPWIELVLLCFIFWHQLRAQHTGFGMGMLSLTLGNQRKEENKCLKKTVEGERKHSPAPGHLGATWKNNNKGMALLPSALQRLPPNHFKLFSALLRWHKSNEGLESLFQG